MIRFFLTLLLLVIQSGCTNDLEIIARWDLAKKMETWVGKDQLILRKEPSLVLDGHYAIAGQAIYSDSPFDPSILYYVDSEGISRVKSLESWIISRGLTSSPGSPTDHCLEVFRLQHLLEGDVMGGVVMDSSVSLNVRPWINLVWNNLLLDSLDAMPTTVNEERLNSEEAIVTFWAIEFVNTYQYECRYPIQPQAPFTLRDSILDAGLIPYP